MLCSNSINNEPVLEDKKHFYVYLKMRPDGRPFYVGKGQGRRAYFLGGRNNYYKNIVAKYGENNIKTTILPMPNEEKSYSEEIRFIAYFKAIGCKLANINIGGEGGRSGIKSPCTPKTAEKISLATKGKPKLKLRGRKQTEEHKKNSGASKRGKPTWSKGKPLSELHRRNIAIAVVGRRPSTEARIKMSISHKDQILPQTFKIGSQPWNKGKKLTEEQKLKKRSSTENNKGHNK